MALRIISADSTKEKIDKQIALRRSVTWGWENKVTLRTRGTQRWHSGSCLLTPLRQSQAGTGTHCRLTYVKRRVQSEPRRNLAKISVAFLPVVVWWIRVVVVVVVVVVVAGGGVWMVVTRKKVDEEA